MNTETVSNVVPHERESWDANLVVGATRLAVFTTLWVIALMWIDQPYQSSSNPYYANMRLGMWLFFVETLVATYQVRYVLPDDYPLHKRSAFVLSQVLASLAPVLATTVVGLFVRWLVLTLGTAAAVALIGPRWPCYLVAFIPSIPALITFLTGVSLMPQPPVIRGTHIRGHNEMKAFVAAIVQRIKTVTADSQEIQGFDRPPLETVDVPTIPCGGVKAPASFSDAHTVLLGATKAGKTLILRTLLPSVLSENGSLQSRAIFYDPKNELLPILAAMVSREQLIILNPGDARCASWDIAKDIQNIDDAYNYAHIFIPPDAAKNENPFFTEAAHALVAMAMMALHYQSPGRWTFADLHNVLRTLDRLKRVLATFPEGRETFSRYFSGAPEQEGGIIATLDAKFLAPYDSIARIWSRSSRSLSVAEWLSGRSIIVLGYDANRLAADRINRAILNRIVAMTAARPDNPHEGGDLTWMFLDEAGFIGSIEKVREAATFGRSKGIRLVLAAQDLAGMHLGWGKERTDSILGACGNVAVLRLSDPETAAWAARRFGEAEMHEIETSTAVGTTTSTGKGGSSTSHSVTHTVSRRRVKRESVLPSEFLNLPTASLAGGVHGFFLMPGLGAWRGVLDSEFLKCHLPPADPHFPSFVPRSPHATDPVRWTEEREAFFTRPPAEPKPRRVDPPSASRQGDLPFPPSPGESPTPPPKALPGANPSDPPRKPKTPDEPGDEGRGRLPTY